MDLSERYWLKEYPSGVPAQIDISAYTSLVQLLEESFSRYADQVAYTCMGADLSYAELDQRSAAVAAWLQQQGVLTGDRVAIMLPNVLQYPVVLAGALRAGAIVVNVNPLYTPHELAFQLSDSGAKTIFVLENFAHTVVEAMKTAPLARVVVCTLGEMFAAPKSWIVNAVVRHVKKRVPAYTLPAGTAVSYAAVLREGRGQAIRAPALTPDSVAVLQYTGGTTGVAKGAMLLHRNLLANILQCEAWYAPGLVKVAAGEQLVTVTALPLYHIFALTCCALFSMRRGGRALLIPNPRDFASVVQALRGVRFHCFPAVNTLFNALANYPAFRTLDFSALAFSMGGGMAVQRAVAERWQALTGCPVCEGYGLSETSPVACANPTNTDHYSGTIGLPLPSTEVAILDDAGARVTPGAPGEICVRGPQVMAGYWNRADETAKVMTADGYFRTGDIGVMDAQGYTRIVDRKKDMILVSGFNVYPNEIEEVVAAHPGVLECAVVGIPDEHSGEAVKLFVVRRDPALSVQDLNAFCHDRLTGYKRPRSIEFLSELPKSNVGKILRRQLRG